MTGIELGRQLALLGAEFAVAPPDAESGAQQNAAERWKALGQRMRAHLASGDPAIRRLRDELGLSEVAYWLTMLCAAVEFYPDAAAAISLLAEDERLHLVTPLCFARLMFQALGVPFAVGLAEAVRGGPVEQLGIVEPEPTPGRPLSQQPLRLAPSELRALLSEGEAVGEAMPILMHREPPAAGTGMDPGFVARAAELLAERGVLAIRCEAARTGRQLAMDLGTHRGEDAILVTLGEELPDVGTLGRLRGGLPVIDLFMYAGAKGFPEAYLKMLAQRLAALVVVIPWNATTGDLPTVEVDHFTLDDRRRIWALEVRDAATADGLARRFRVNLEDVRGATRAARDSVRVRAGNHSEPSLDEITEQLLAQGARKMGRLVSRLRSRATLENLIVPPSLRHQLEDMIAWHRASPKVFEEWKVGGRTQLGRGLTCLFTGPPGTGKTFAAQCLANALGLNLYRIDLSQVVSKYIGETEKALAKVFDEADAGHGVLLFDEADALFGKRSEVKDAHDRYANIEVGYLLQRFESFDGISILTTNLRNNIDEAFTRRLRFIMNFPLPDGEARRRLWEQALPSQDHWDRSIDLDVFAERFQIAGGNIHNIGVAAAHLAASSEDGILRIDHLVRSTFRELEKAGMSRSKEDFGPLGAYLPGRM